MKIQKKINKQLFLFYKNLFSEKIENDTVVLKEFFDNVNIPKLSPEQINVCEGHITENELLDALKSMDNNKSPGNSYKGILCIILE